MKYYIIALVYAFSVFYSHEFGFITGASEQKRIDHKKLQECHMVLTGGLYK